MTPRLVLLLAAAAAVLQAQPQIRKGGIVNAASYFAIDGNGSNPVSPGAYFVIFGSGLGPANIVVGSLPFGKQLPDATGTSVRFSIPNGPFYDAFMYYAVGTQLAGILPSNVPPGLYNVTVTYNGKTSPPEQVFVIKSNPGIFTRNQAGTGLVKAQVYRTATDFFEPTLSAPAAPGQTVVLYGTGLGPVNAPDNSAPGAVQVTDPVTVYINGAAVQPFYAGRSPQYPGLDQIDFILPADVVPGCYTDVIVAVNGVSSNVVAVPTAAPGAACSHPFGLNAAALAKLDNGGTVTVGATGVLSHINAGTDPGDAAVAVFFTANADGIFEASRELGNPNQLPFPVPAGKCVVWDTQGPSRNKDLNVAGWGTEVSAGTSMTLVSPTGTSTTLTSGSAIGIGGGYAAILPLGTITAGAWTFQANGGTIGSFSNTVQASAPIQWVSAPADNSTITRNSGLATGWTGGGALVHIAGESSGGSNGDKTFACSFNGSDGKGTVPAAILNQLPIPAPGDQNGGGKIALLSGPAGTFTAPGKLDGGMTLAVSGDNHPVIWK